MALRARLLKIALILLVLIGIAMVIRRTLILTAIIPSVNPRGGLPFDTGFGKHPVITFVHIVPGLLFMILALFQLPVSESRGLLKRQLFILTGLWVGCSAVCMPFIMLPIGGINEAASSVLYALLFIFFGLRAWMNLQRKNWTGYREWLIRFLAIGVAISTVRPIMVLFFALTKLPPSIFFGTAFWLGFTIHLIAAESWIRYTKSP
jgi:hypothetical protein